MPSGYNLKAQPAEGVFLNANGTYKASNIGTGANKHKQGGIIRMKGTAATSGTFSGIGENPYANGTSNPTGRIDGTVIWTKNGNQDVQPRYYTNLGVASPNTHTGTGEYVRNFGGTSKATMGKYFVSGDFKRFANTLRANPITDAEAIKYRDNGNTKYTSATVPSYLTKLPYIVHSCYSEFWYDGSPDAQVVLGSIVDTMMTPSGASGLLHQDNYYSFLMQYNSGNLTLGSFTQAQIFQQLAQPIETVMPTRPSISSGPLQMASSAALYLLIDVEGCDTTKNDTTKIDTSEVIDCDHPLWAGIPCNPDPPCTGPNCDTVDPCGHGPALIAGPNTVIEITRGISYEGDDEGFVIPFCFYAEGGCADVANTNEPTRVIYRNSALGVYPAYYGILELGSDIVAGNDKRILNGGNVYIKGKRPYALDFKTSANLIAKTTTGTTDWLVSPTTTNVGQYLAFTDTCAAPTYASCGEVVGWIYRTESDNRLYTYHNDRTKVSLNGIPVDASGDQWFGLLSIPKTYGGLVGTGGNSKAKLLTDYNPASPAAPLYGYVDRVWSVNYADANPNAAINEMHLGNRIDEIPPVLCSAWSTLRGYEAWDVTKQPELLVGNGGYEWLVNNTNIGTTCTSLVASGACNALFAMDQSAGRKILLPDKTNRESNPADGELDDVYPGSQIVFGNIPAAILSKRNGRWSDPGTWGGSVPKPTDSVGIRHWVYTGIYDPANNTVVGERAWSTNEHHLPAAVDTDPTVATLARYVNIWSANAIIADPPVKKANPDGKAGLIIGNHELGGIFTESALANGGNDTATQTINQPMNFDITLTFGIIENNNNGGADWTNLLTLNDMTTTFTPTTFAVGGVFLMGGTGASQTDALPITNAWSFWNKGRLNNQAIFDVGK